MIRTKVLVVEDEESAQEFYQCFFKVLHNDKFIWKLAPNGEAALKHLEQDSADLIILDWELPGLSGLQVLKAIRRKNKSVLVLMATAHAEAENISTALDAGADDYFVKPLSERIFLSHMKALERRRMYWPETSAYEIDGIRIDLRNGFLLSESGRVELTGTERDLLIVFLQRPDTVHSSDYLLEAIWGHKTPKHHVLERHVCSLRKKLGSQCGSRLKSKYGSGYHFDLSFPSVTATHP